MKRKTICIGLTIMMAIFANINFISAIFLSGDDKFQAIVKGFLMLIVSIQFSRMDTR